MIDIAEAACIAQFEAFSEQETSGELDTGWLQIVNRVRNIMSGDLTKKLSLANATNNYKMLMDGCAPWSAICRGLSPYPAYKELKSKDGNFVSHLEQHLASIDIFRLDKDEAYKRYNTRAIIFERRG